MHNGITGQTFKGRKEIKKLNKANKSKFVKEIQVKL